MRTLLFYGIGVIILFGFCVVGAVVLVCNWSIYHSPLTLAATILCGVVGIMWSFAFYTFYTELRKAKKK